MDHNVLNWRAVTDYFLHALVAQILQMLIPTCDQLGQCIFFEYSDTIGSAEHGRPSLLTLQIIRLLLRDFVTQVRELFGILH